MNLTFENEPSNNRDSNVKFAPLEHFQEKWNPVFRPKMRQDKELEPHSDSIGMEEALDRNDGPRPTKSGECNAMMRNTPPFRADMVGSLLRTQPLKHARAEREAGRISVDELRAVEDREIRALIGKQEEIGLKAVTDGEFRRAFWHFDFMEELDGVEGFWKDEAGVQFQGATLKPRAQRVVGKLGFPATHPMLEHFRFVKANTSRTAKMTIPSPSMLHYRGGRDMIDRTVYPDMDGFYADLGDAYAGAVRGFAEAGCRYLQLDDVSFAYLCDPSQRQMLKDRGDDPEKQPEIYAGMINKAVGGRPDGMAVTMHMCRGNFRSTFIASGGYEPVAEILFNGINIDGYFMEWDTDRAGGFEPLRFLPKGKTVVLGLVTTKTGTLESRDDIKRRIEEAAKYCDLDQLCLSPQCGFASTEEGNVLAEEQQWAKLRMIVEIAEEVWG
jgi:5-methyltetrahydropteroyltriglutamate--homocysteine methyltransferase